MKTTFFALFCALQICSAHGQFFVQQLSPYQLQNAEKTYVVLNSGDSIVGEITSTSFVDSLLTKFTLKSIDEKRKFSLEEIQAIAVIPNELANYEDFALMPVLKNLKNDAFIEVLPADGWVIFEKIRLPGNQERYALTQLLNPGFDQKIKVYKDPESASTGSSTLNGMTIGGNLDDQYLVVVNGGTPFRIGNFRYRKQAPELLYSGCAQLADQKLKWKDFATHVYTHFKSCE